MRFESKARNLQNLIGKLKSAKILPLIIINKDDINKTSTINKIMAQGWENMIVRSSAKCEDSTTSSHAGEFLSIQNISQKTLGKALNEVAKSLPGDDDEIFIQPMCDKLDSFVVAMSASGGANYVSINIDNSGDSSSITNGTGSFSKIMVLKTKRTSDKKINAILELIAELEMIFNCDALDLEAGFVGSELYLFQVRSIASASKTLDVSEPLTFIESKIKKISKERPNIFGKKSIFGIMPDWNPAEILGLKAKRLAISLYKELITDKIWALGRAAYGYKDLSDFPLMFDFAGLCYIDVRTSFNSFLPKNLDKKTSQKLVEYYLDELKKNPSKHDKIEFDIAFSSYEFDLEGRLERCAALNKTQKISLQKKLKQISIGIFKNNSVFYKDLEDIRKLDEKMREYKNTDLASVDKIYWLISECKRYGTKAFSGIARAAFIATSLLNSLVRVGGISIDEKNKFLSSFSTISGKLASDISSLSKTDFLAKYGHLRTNTYEITSPSYNENYEKYFKKASFNKSNANTEFVPKNVKKIEEILEFHDFKMSVDEFFNFLALAIQAREEAKFIFTKALSSVLDEIAIFCKSCGISKDDASHLDIALLLGFYTRLENIQAKEQMRTNIAHNKKEYEISCKLSLPPLITDASDVYFFTLDKHTPNFITQKCISAKPAAPNEEKLDGKIICIHSADPGYDFIFTHKIAGLITAFGGANSHMAVRANEFGLPSAIGVGDELLERCLSSNIITLDCLNQRIEL